MESHYLNLWDRHNLTAVKRSKLLRILLLLLASYLMFLSTLASAAYQYEYTGNPFTTTFNSHILLPDPPYVWEVSLPQQEYISVAFTSDTLLSPGANFSDISDFSITAVNPDNYRQLVYPSPFPTDPSGNPSLGNLVYDGVFNISSVDANGLPTGWNISVDFNYSAPTGRFTQTFLQTSTNQEKTLGGYEGFFDYYGESNNNPGTWTMVSVVPEPETYAMLLLGLGMVAYASKKRKTG